MLITRSDFITVKMQRRRQPTTKTLVALKGLIQARSKRLRAYQRQAGRENLLKKSRCSIPLILTDIRSITTQLWFLQVSIVDAMYDIWSERLRFAETRIGTFRFLLSFYDLGNFLLYHPVFSLWNELKNYLWLSSSTGFKEHQTALSSKPTFPTQPPYFVPGETEGIVQSSCQNTTTGQANWVRRGGSRSGSWTAESDLWTTVSN